MSIQIIDNFDVRVAKPVDNRMIVGPSQVYINREVVENKYKGLFIWDENANTQYVWKGTTWSVTNDTIQTSHNNASSSNHYLTFVSSTFSNVYSLNTSDKIRYKPSTGQLTLGDGSATLPTIQFGLFTTNTGIYKPSTNALAITIGGVNRFEFGNSETKSNTRFRIDANSLADTIGQGTLSIRDSLGEVTSEFFAFSPDPKFKIYSSSPTQIVAGFSGNTRETTAITFINANGLSINEVRDLHHFNVESQRGKLCIGNKSSGGADNEQFQFWMKGYTTLTAIDGSPASSIFSANGGGLRVKNNLKIDGSSWVIGTSKSGFFSSGDGSVSDPAFKFTNDTNTGIYRFNSTIGIALNGQLSGRFARIRYSQNALDQHYGFASDIISTPRLIYSNTPLSSTTLINNPSSKTVDGIFATSGTVNVLLVDQEFLMGSIYYNNTSYFYIEYDFVGTMGTYWSAKSQKIFYQWQLGATAPLSSYISTDITTHEEDNIIPMSGIGISFYVQPEFASNNFGRLKFYTTFLNGSGSSKSFDIIVKYKITNVSVNTSPPPPPSPTTSSTTPGPTTGFGG
jgi:hypothetical protein